MDGTREELLDAIRTRYRRASKSAKGIILDKLVVLMKCHRKHAIRLLAQDSRKRISAKGRNQIYDEAVREALIVI